MGSRKVVIFGKEYKLRCDEGEENYIDKVAAKVDKLMWKMAKALKENDECKIAILVALNLAEENIRHQEVERKISELILRLEKSLVDEKVNSSLRQV